MALFLGGVFAVFLANRVKSEGDVDAEGGYDLELNLAEVILSGRGFDYEVTDGERRLYHIRADRIIANRDNVVTLTGIVITVERASGEVYALAAKKGIYRSANSTAEVEGDAVLSGPDGLEMRGQRFDLLRHGSVVKSRGPVEFTVGPGLTGSADAIEAYLDRDRFQLSGKVRLFSQGAGPEDDLSLEAERMIYNKSDNRIHAEGGIRFRRGRDQMTCDRIAVTLAGDAGSTNSGGSGARFVRARWNVVGSLVSHDARGFDRRLEFAGEEISIVYGKNGSEPRQVEITGTVKEPARLDASDDSGLVRRFSSRRIEATFALGQIRRIQTGGAMIMTEFLAFDPSRELGRVCGRSATAKFDTQGDLIRLVVAGDAELHRPGLQTTGEALTILAPDLVRVEGSPAHVYAWEGELSAPGLEYRIGTGELTARGGVRAWFPPKSGFTMVTATEAADELPIQVTADSATWGQTRGRFQFDGNVRAWQGESFLTAQRLIGENGGRIRGEGGIQTTLERRASALSEAGDNGEEPSSRVRVTAASFDYRKGERLIEYKGNPEVRDAGRVMSCDELSVHLREDSSLDRMECRGDTLIDDRIGGHKISGSKALYRPDESKVEVSGSPVTLQKPDGAVIRASRVIYDFETSIAQFQSDGSRGVQNEGERASEGGGM